MASITLSQAEKAFEFDRAKELLARSGRSGGLAYELTKLVEAADRRRGRFDEATTPQAKLLPPRLQPGDRVEAKCGPHLGRCGTVSRVYNTSAQVAVQFDLLATQQVYHEGNLRRLPAKPPAPTFSPGSTVALRSNGRRGYVIANWSSSDQVHVRLEGDKEGRIVPASDVRHDPTPFCVGDRVITTLGRSVGRVVHVGDRLVEVKFNSLREPLRYLHRELRHAE